MKTVHKYAVDAADTIQAERGKIGDTFLAPNEGQGHDLTLHDLIEKGYRNRKLLSRLVKVSPIRKATRHVWWYWRIVSIQSLPENCEIPPVFDWRKIGGLFMSILRRGQGNVLVIHDPKKDLWVQCCQPSRGQHQRKCGASFNLSLRQAREVVKKGIRAKELRFDSCGCPCAGDLQEVSGEGGEDWLLYEIKGRLKPKPVWENGKIVGFK